MRVDGQHHALAALHLGIARYPLYRRLYRTQGRSGWVQNNLPPLGFEPWTVHPIGSRSTHYTILTLFSYKFFSLLIHSWLIMSLRKGSHGHSMSLKTFWSSQLHFNITLSCSADGSLSLIQVCYLFNYINQTISKKKRKVVIVI